MTSRMLLFPWLSSFLPDASFPLPITSIFLTGLLWDFDFFTLKFSLNYGICSQNFNCRLMIAWVLGPDLCVFKTLGIFICISILQVPRFRVSNPRYLIPAQVWPPLVNGTAYHSAIQGRHLRWILTYSFYFSFICPYSIAIRPILFNLFC